MSDAQWREVLARKGKLAWQALPADAPNLRRITHYLRLSWQPEDWALSLDAQYHPADAGRVVTAGAQWQGEGLRVNAAMRWFGGPQDSIARQRPYKREGLLLATWGY